MADKKPISRILEFVAIFALIFIIGQFARDYFFPAENPETVGKVIISMQDATIRSGADPVLIIQNNTDQLLNPPATCPDLPVEAFFIENPGTSDEKKVLLDSGVTAIPCTDIESIPAGESVNVTLAPWKYSNFGRIGLYEVSLPMDDTQTGSGTVEGSTADSTLTTRFTISEPGVFVKLFRALITKPFLNGLIFIASILPGHSLGWGIIILTILVKLLLYMPTQQALKGQKKMQLLQPKIEALRKQYKDDPKKQHEETMKLWKEHKVNPLQSCLPLLLQFPILIGLFYVVRDGSVLELSRHLVYDTYQNIDWTFDKHFLGFDLTQPSMFVFPPLLVVLQFIQMKLSFHIADKKKAKELEKKTTPEVDTPQEVQQKVMMYVLPFIIGFFALRFPTAVSLYWGISTLFAIGQQVIVNREHLGPVKS